MSNVPLSEDAFRSDEIILEDWAFISSKEESLKMQSFIIVFFRFASEKAIYSPEDASIEVFLKTEPEKSAPESFEFLITVPVSFVLAKDADDRLQPSKVQRLKAPPLKEADEKSVLRNAQSEKTAPERS